MTDGPGPITDDMVAVVARHTGTDEPTTRAILEAGLPRLFGAALVEHARLRAHAQKWMRQAALETDLNDGLRIAEEWEKMRAERERALSDRLALVLAELWDAYDFDRADHPNIDPILAEWRGARA